MCGIAIDPLYSGCSVFRSDLFGGNQHFGTNICSDDMARRADAYCRDAGDDTGTAGHIENAVATTDAR